MVQQNLFNVSTHYLPFTTIYFESKFLFTEFWLRGLNLQPYNAK